MKQFLLALLLTVAFSNIAHANAAGDCVSACFNSFSCASEEQMGADPITCEGGRDRLGWAVNTDAHQSGLDAIKKCSMNSKGNDHSRCFIQLYHCYSE